MPSLQTIPLFIAANGITADSRQVDAPEDKSDWSDWDKDASHWEVTIRHGCRTFTASYSMGSAHKGQPQLADVLGCLQSDIQGVINARDFEDWARELDFDTDSRKAEQIYKVCYALAVNLQRLFGVALYAEFLECQETD